MADEPLIEHPAPGPTCPWCSAPLPGVDAESCPACGARLVGEEGVEIPGVTSVLPDLLASAASPRKVKRTFGALLVGDDNEIPPPSEAEMPALAPPDADVRREMLRLVMDARLADLQAEAKALAAEGHLDIDEALLRPVDAEERSADAEERSADAAGPSSDAAAPPAEAAEPSPEVGGTAIGDPGDPGALAGRDEPGAPAPGA